MEKISSSELSFFLLILGIILIFYKPFAKFTYKIGLSAITGEILLGAILGPTVFANIFPNVYHKFFYDVNVKSAFDSFESIAVIMFLFSSSLDIKIEKINSKIKSIFTITFFTLVPSFFIGFYLTYLMPSIFHNSDNKIFIPFFMGIFTSISALTVIIRVLKERNKINTDLGTSISFSLVLIYLIEMILFSSLIKLFNENKFDMLILYQALISVLFIVIFFTLGTKIFDVLFDIFMSKKHQSLGISVIIGFLLIVSSLSEYLNVSLLTGAFLMGIIVSNSKHSKDLEKFKDVIFNFSNEFFTPIFFVFIGMKTNFILGFDIYLLVIIIFISFLSKTIPSYIGAKIAGFSKKDSIVFASIMNTKGIVPIILGEIAMKNSIINQELFVGIVIASLITTIISTPVINYIDN
jgi:Kef-type K+ transport system membrane component KefB